MFKILTMFKNQENTHYILIKSYPKKLEMTRKKIHRYYKKI